LTIKDSELIFLNNANEPFAPKKYAKYIKIKDSKYTFLEKTNKFDVPAVIKYIGGSSVLETLNLCLE
jgi:hypothetical protein